MKEPTYRGPASRRRPWLPPLTWKEPARLQHGTTAPVQCGRAAILLAALRVQVPRRSAWAGRLIELEELAGLCSLAPAVSQLPGNRAGGGQPPAGDPDRPRAAQREAPHRGPGLRD